MYNNLFVITLQALNRYFDLSDQSFSLNFESDDFKQKEFDINLILKIFNFHNVAVSFFLISGSVVLIYYLNESYHECLLEYLKEFHEYLHPPIVHKINQGIVLVRANKDFLLYKESDIQRILGFRSKRFFNFLKENEEKMPYINLEEFPLKIETIYIF